MRPGILEVVFVTEFGAPLRRNPHQEGLPFIAIPFASSRESFMLPPCRCNGAPLRSVSAPP